MFLNPSPNPALDLAENEPPGDPIPRLALHRLGKITRSFESCGVIRISGIPIQVPYPTPEAAARSKCPPNVFDSHLTPSVMPLTSVFPPPPIWTPVMPEAFEITYSLRRYS
jgi:hypothetical protein